MAMSMPMQIDGFTRLTKVNYHYPNTIIVYARISLSRDQISEFASLEEIKERMQQDTIRKACSEPVIETMLSAGMIITYTYLDEAHQNLFSLSAFDGDCLADAAVSLDGR
jgi:hypothetical protein